MDSKFVKDFFCKNKKQSTQIACKCYINLCIWLEPFDFGYGLISNVPETLVFGCFFVRK